MGTDRDADSPLGLLHRARAEDPTVDALASMAEAGRLDVLDPVVLTQIIYMLTLRVAGARQLLVDLATIAPPTMAADGPPPVRAPGLASLRGSLAHRDAEASVNGHAPGPTAPGRTVGHFEVEAVRGVGSMAIGVNLRHLDPSNVAVDGAASLLTVGSRVRVVRDDGAPQEAEGPHAVPWHGASVGPLVIVDCQVSDAHFGGPTIVLDVQLRQAFGCAAASEAREMKEEIVRIMHANGASVRLVRDPEGGVSS